MKDTVTTVMLFQKRFKITIFELASEICCIKHPKIKTELNIEKEYSRGTFWIPQRGKHNNNVLLKYLKKNKSS